MFGASPALPTKDAQPGQGLRLFQGSSSSAVSNGVNIYVQLKGKPCSWHLPAAAPLHSSLFWSRILHLSKAKASF